MADSLALSSKDIQFIEVDGLNIRVFTQNLDEDAPPLLLLNGLGQSIEILFPLIESIGARPIITFDAVGVGHSEVPNKDFAIKDHAKVVSLMLDQLGVKQVDALGISWGGAVAQQFAHSYPEQCRKLVLAITSTGGLTNWWGGPISLFEIQVPLRLFNREYAKFVGPLMYGGEALLDPSLFSEYMKNGVRPSYKGYRAQVKAMCSWSSLGWVHRLKQKTLVISGLFDSLIPAPNQMTLATLIPDSNLVTLPAGHLLMYSRRDVVAEHINGFLA